MCSARLTHVLSYAYSIGVHRIAVMAQSYLYLTLTVLAFCWRKSQATHDGVRNGVASSHATSGVSKLVVAVEDWG